MSIYTAVMKTICHKGLNPIQHWQDMQKRWETQWDVCLKPLKTVNAYKWLHHASQPSYLRVGTAFATHSFTKSTGWKPHSWNPQRSWCFYWFMFADMRAMALSQHSPLNPAQPHKLTFRSSNFYAVCTVIKKMFNYKYLNAFIKGKFKRHLCVCFAFNYLLFVRP